MTNTSRREVKESNATREMVYTSLDTLEIPEHKFLGRTSEGLVFENSDGLSLVVKVIMKSLDFDAEGEIEDYDTKQTDKVKKLAEKEKKVAKAKEKKVEEKAE